MDRQLLLLGLLRQEDMHAYQLNEQLKSGVGQPISLKRATVYDLLRKMEKEGWIASREEKVGNRPRRRVYAITPDGEGAFQRLVRERLGQYPKPELPAAVSLAFVRQLPRTVALGLLQRRRRKVTALADELGAHLARLTENGDDSFSSLHKDYMYHFYETEAAWLDKILVQLSETEDA
jgi:DNA-binding PadR family transcriptional regulator